MVRYLAVMERGSGGRYTLLTADQDEAKLRKFGFTAEMLADQKWAKEAPMDTLNKDWPTSKGRLSPHPHVTPTAQ
jgi:hypothetical protein